MRWTVELLPEAAEELDGMPADIRARFRRLAALIEEHGLLALREPYVRHLDGKLWEMRVKGRDGIARAFYFVTTPRRVVVVRAFIKKTRKTPRRELVLAHRRMREWLP